MRYGIETQCEKLGVALSAGYDFNGDKALPAADGLLVIGRPQPALYEQLRQQETPVVFIDGVVEDERFDCVNVDLYKISRKVIDYFIGRGYQRIGFIGGRDHPAGIDQREQAFVEYGRQQNVVRAQDIYHGDFSSQSGYQCAKAMLQSQNGYPPALLVATDSIAIGVLRAARTRHSGAGADRADQRQRYSHRPLYFPRLVHGAHPFGNHGRTGRQPADGAAAR